MTLFRVGGTEVKVHWSFILILIWGAVSYSVLLGSWTEGALYGVLVILLLFVCVVLHEFGHAVASKRYGIGVPTITLLPIGGLAQLESMPKNPMQELVIALAGPLVNVVLALLLVPLAAGLAAATGEPSLGLNVGAWMRASLEPGVANLTYYMAAVNMLLAVFNLLPAFPMDGGRVLRALLAMGMPQVRATRIAVFVGRMLAIGLAVWGIVTGNILMPLIAFFIYVGGGAELQAVETRRVLTRIHVRQAVIPDAERLYTTEPLQRAVDLIMTSYQEDFPVFDLGNKYVGVLTRPRLVDALRVHGPTGRVNAAMIPAEQVPVVEPDESLNEVYERMAEAGSRVVAVREGSQFLGLLGVQDIAEVVNVVGAVMESSDARLPSGAAPAPASLTSATGAPFDATGDRSEPPADGGGSRGGV